MTLTVYVVATSREAAEELAVDMDSVSHEETKREAGIAARVATSRSKMPHFAYAVELAPVKTRVLAYCERCGDEGKIYVGPEDDLEAVPCPEPGCEFSR